jgi:hypothetical protein
LIKVSGREIGGVANAPNGKVQQGTLKVAGRLAQQAKSLDQQFFDPTWNVVGDIEDVTEGAQRRNEWYCRRLLTTVRWVRVLMYRWNPLWHNAAGKCKWRRMC